MSVPLQTVPGNQENDNEIAGDPVAQAKQEAAEIVARARMKAEAIIAEARTSQPAASSPLAALGDNAEEIMGQVRKLIKKQRVVEGERQALAAEVETLKVERDELVQRLTDAVVRMEELSEIAANAQASPAAMSAPPAATPPPPSEAAPLESRLEQAERAEPEDTSLAARLERAEREERQAAPQPDNEPPAPVAPAASNGHSDSRTPYVAKDSDDSFYSRHSAKLPRLEGDGGRSVLSAVGGMRPEPEPKRKGRRGWRKP